MSWPAGAKAN